LIGMVAIYTFSGRIDDFRRRDIVFGGGIILFKRVPELLRLGEFVRSEARAVFEPWDPVRAHDHLDRDDYLARVEKFQRSMTNSPRVKHEFAGLLAGLGLDLKMTGCSRFTFRVQPPASSFIDRNTASLGVHRDSWYGRDFEQTNWWTPWTPLDQGRNLRIFHRNWTNPLPNSSEGWRLAEFRKARAEVTEQNGSFQKLLAAYPSVKPLEELRESEAIELIIEPGDLLNFSTAHLHQGPANATGLSRFSGDFRTIHADDVIAGRGAPNQDSKSTGSGIMDFKRLEDGRGLTDIISQLTDAPPRSYSA
jgi:hypothetical protein